MLHTLQHIKSWTKDFVDLFAPRTCPGCGIPLQAHEKTLCALCLLDLPVTQYHEDRENPVARLFWGRVEMECATAFMEFNKSGKVQHMMHQVKYHHGLELGRELGAMAAESVFKHPDFKDAVGLVPVPLHEKKLHKRGFNQAQIIAEGIERTTDIPVLDILHRRVDNASQTHKGRFERWENVKNAFILKPRVSVPEGLLIIVDDVVTTGSTVEACAYAIQGTAGNQTGLFTLACA